MKQIKNATLAVIGGLFILSVAMVACKGKSSSSSSTPAPTVASVSPTSAAIGATISVTGTGFTATGTTATIGGVAATVVYNSSTSITVTVPSAALGSDNLIVTTANGSSTAVSITVTASAYTGPTSNSVASANLIAHWTFDASSIETGSQLSALTGGNYNVGTVTYSNPGVIGNCATFTAGALVYPELPQFVDTALESYTVSLWVKLGSRGSSPKWQSLFQLNSNAYTGLFGLIGVQVLNNNSGDTLPLQITQVQYASQGPQLGGFGCGGCFTGLTSPIVYTPSSATAWTLLTTTYNGNGNNETLKEYANGVLLDTLVLTNVLKPATFRILPTGGSTPPIPSSWGNFVTIGTFNFSDFPEFSSSNGYSAYSSTAASVSSYQANGITGSLDDIRVFSTSLSVAQVDSLYNIGSTGH